MFDDNKPNWLKKWFAFSLMCLGLGIGYNLPPTYEVVIAVVVLNIGGLWELWVYDIDFLMWRRANYGETHPQLEAVVNDIAPIKPRKIVDLNEKNNIWQQSLEVNVHQADKRWQQFGYAVINGQPMTQSKWTGKGRPFSRPEFEKQIKKWLIDLVIVHKKIKGKNAGYHPNGSEGWRYFKALADGRVLIPLPTKEVM